mgnify:CR=1 FL=1
MEEWQVHDVAGRKGFAFAIAVSAVTATSLVCATRPATAAEPGTVTTIATHAETDEPVTRRQMPRVKHRKPAVKSATAKTSGQDGLWLFDYVARLLGTEPEAAKRSRQAKGRSALPAKRIATATPVAAPALAIPFAPAPASAPEKNQQRVTILPTTAVPAIVPVAPAAPATPTPQQQAAVTPPAPAHSATAGSIIKPAAAATEPVRQAAPSQPSGPSVAIPQPPAAPRSEPIVTGALPGIGSVRDAAPRIVTPDASEALVEAAERAQARADLVKLELASRTYAERRVSGQSVFDLRLDWKVLERARDALSESELAAAEAAGFEANAYVNDATKTIVVAVAGSEDLRRDFLQADIWDALIRAQMPQQFFLAKTYTRSVIQRYQSKGYSAECVGHSLGGGACAYVAAELGIRAIVVNPISAGKLPAAARHLVTNYVVDGEIANLVYGARGNEIAGDVQRVSGGRAEARERAVEKYGPLAGPVLVVKTLSDMVRGHKVERALDLIAAHAGIERPR